jgi:STE24 endopeptidase
MYNTVFIVIVAIIVFNYIMERFLSYLNMKNMSTQLPEELQGIYDEEKYKKQQQYQLVNSKFGFITSTFSFVVILAMLIAGGFAWVDQVAGTWADNPIWIALVFFGILMFASDLINLPFAIYDTFVIEEKFGFNRTTPKIFVFDKIKSWFLSALLGGGILAVIVWFYLETQELFWIYALGVSTIFMLFMAMFYSQIIVPLFNKQTPLEEGSLRDKIEEFANQVGFRLKNIYVIDGSKRSSKANAYFTGLGTRKRIVLFDTLIKELTEEEVVAVLAHEIGHYKKKHTIKGMGLSIVQTGLTFYILGLLVGNPQLSEALGSSNASFHLGLVAFGILYSPISLTLGLGGNIFSRKNEYEADAFAKNNYGTEPMINALKKLSVNNLSNLTPHPVFVFFHYSHPTLLQRINALRKD